MSDYFIFDGVDSRTFDAVVYERNTFSSPARQFTTVTIPGRSGDFLLDGSRFGNVAHEYDVVIYRRFDENFEALKAFLLSRDGYCRLEDSIHPNEYYHAYYSEPITPEVTRNRDMGKFVLRFNRKPQRWLLSGQDEIILRTGGSTRKTTVANPTRFNCYPLLMFKGDNLRNGFTVSIRGTQIKLTAYDPDTNNYPASGHLNNYWLYIDLATAQAYVKYSTSTTYYYNKAIQYTLPADVKSAFQLAPGNNNIGMGNVSNVTEMKMIPRWYTL